MANLGDGSGTGYPGAVDTSDTEVNSPNAAKTKARAEVENDQYAAIIAVETELGTDPAGSLTDVKTFLQTEHDTDGTHGDVTAGDVTTNSLTVGGKGIVTKFNGTFTTASLAQDSLDDRDITHGLGSDDVVVSVTGIQNGSAAQNSQWAVTNILPSGRVITQSGAGGLSGAFTPGSPASGDVNFKTINRGGATGTITINFVIMRIDL